MEVFQIILFLKKGNVVKHFVVVSQLESFYVFLMFKWGYGFGRRNQKGEILFLLHHIKDPYYYHEYHYVDLDCLEGLIFVRFSSKIIPSISAFPYCTFYLIIFL
jgi:hypothetical protein